MSDIEQRVTDIVTVASNGRVKPTDLLAANGDLVNAGMESIDVIAVIEGLEAEFGLIIDMHEDPEFLTTIQTMAAYVQANIFAEVTS